MLISCYVILLKDPSDEMEDGVAGLGLVDGVNVFTFAAATLVFAVAPILLILLFSLFGACECIPLELIETEVAKDLESLLYCSENISSMAFLSSSPK